MKVPMPLTLAATFALSSSVLFAEGQPNPKPAASQVAVSDSDLESALAELKASAERLGKSMTSAAESGTSEAKLKLLTKMKKAIHELSSSMDRAAKKISPTPVATPK